MAKDELPPIWSAEYKAKALRGEVDMPDMHKPDAPEPEEPKAEKPKKVKAPKAEKEPVAADPDEKLSGADEK